MADNKKDDGMGLLKLWGTPEEREAQKKKAEERAPEKAVIIDKLNKINDDMSEEEQQKLYNESRILAFDYNEKYIEDEENPVCCFCKTYCEGKHGYDPYPAWIGEDRGEKAVCCEYCRKEIVEPARQKQYEI